MSEEQKIEDMRYELGRDAKQQGEPLHEGASEEYRRGYNSYRGFGSNVQPRLFGRGASRPSEWTCVCGHTNKRYLVQCEVCMVRRSLALQATEGGSR